MFQTEFCAPDEWINEWVENIIQIKRSGITFILRDSEGL